MQLAQWNSCMTGSVNWTGDCCCVTDMSQDMCGGPFGSLPGPMTMCSLVEGGGSDLRLNTHTSHALRQWATTGITIQSVSR